MNLLRLLRFTNNAAPARSITGAAQTSTARGGWRLSGVLRFAAPQSGLCSWCDIPLVRKARPEQRRGSVSGNVWRQKKLINED